jgi:hypothetical protein
MKAITSLLLAAGVFAGVLSATAADEKASTAKPYKLDTCIVSDEKLGEMGKPYVMEHNGQEVKMCCKSCKKDFDKNPDKFMKKLAEKEKKAAAKSEKDSHAGHNH